MNQEYTLSLFSKFFYGLFTVIMIGVAYILVMDGSPGTPAILVSILLLAGAVSLALYIIKRKVIVSGSEIVVTGAFGSGRTSIHNIKGIAMGKQTMCMFPVETDGKKLMIFDYTAIGNNSALKQWLLNNFKDLKQEEFENEKASILQNPRWGATTEERRLAYKAAKIIATAYTVIAIVLVAIAVFMPVNSKILSFLLLFFPLAGVVVMAYSRGLIILLARTRSAYPSVFIGMFSSCIGLLFQSMNNIQVLNNSGIWYPAAAVALVLVTLISIIVIKQPGQSFKNQLFFILLFSAFYGYASLMSLDISMDGSVPLVYSTKVTARYISRTNKNTTYNLTLNGWGPHHAVDHVSVSAAFYNRVDTGEMVKVYLQRGYFKIPWYYVNL